MSTAVESSGKADHNGSKSETMKENGDLTEDQQLQFETIRPNITDAVEILKGCTDYNSQESLDAFELLSKYGEMNSLRQRLAEHIVALDASSVFPLAWQQLKEKADGTEGESKNRPLTILFYMKTFFTNFSDASPRLCQQLGEQGAFKLLFEEFAKDFNVKDLENNEMMNNQFEASLGILHNCIRQWHDNVSLYREAGAVELLTKYLRSDHPLAKKSKCLLTLSYVVNDEENGNLATRDGSVTYLLDLLKKAVATPDHREHCGDCAFSVAELLDGLNHVAKNDCNKVKIVEGGGVSILSEILQQDFSQEEHTLSARGLWLLAFVVSNREIIKKQRNILQEGNMLESMAKAVENAAVILVAVSQRYKDSLNCRSEASYAYRLKKPLIPIMVQEGYRPDGWLGIMVAMNKYYRCYTEAMIDEQLPSLTHELGDKGHL